SLASLIPLNPQSITEDSAAYHAVTGGVLAGAALASVYKMGLPRLLDRVFRKPLGLRYFSFGLSAAAQRGTEFVHEYITGVKPNVLLQQWVSRLVGASFQEVVRITHDPRFRRAVIPAVNVYATAEEVCCFFQMLMQHGRYGTQQVLAPATVSAALRPMGGWCFDRQFMLPMRYSKGFMLGANPLGLWGPFSEKSFGHLGFTNKWSWAIPHSQTAVCLLSNGNCLAGAPIKPMVQFVLEVQRLGGLFT
ncbi:MAG: serine hydrolase, partial [Gammaproteobacteria bacterium]